MSPAPEAGPSVASLAERAADELTAQGHPVLAEAVRQAGAYNRQLLEHIDTLTGLLDQAARAGETYAGMYRLAVENAEHYRSLLQRIAKSTSHEDAIEIAQGALR